jgi:hypothetical protein
MQKAYCLKNHLVEQKQQIQWLKFAGIVIVAGFS